MPPPECVMTPDAVEALANPDTVVVVTRQSDATIRIVTDGWPAGVDPGTQPVMTTAGVVAVMLDDESSFATSDFSDARSLLFQREDATSLLAAVGFGQWRARTRFCSRCGQPLQPDAGGKVLRCANDHMHFPHIEPAVIMRVTDDADRVLLARQPSWMRGRFSVLAGFVDPGEPLEDAVRREVMEEVGLTVGQVSYVKSQAWPFPSSLMVAFAATAETTDIRLMDDEIAEAGWYTREELTTAMDIGEVALPPPLSVAHQLLRTWMKGD